MEHRFGVADVSDFIEVFEAAGEGDSAAFVKAVLLGPGPMTSS